MNAADAVERLGALAQETRLAIYRLLVEAGPAGLPAGAIAERLEVPPSSLSFHLAELRRAGLISQQRESRSLVYSADFRAMNGLLSYLSENCCGGDRAACAPVLAAPSIRQSKGARHEAPARTRRRR